ncbi:hypothetical protein GCM10011390_11060 [Aureimonas endophytica]|uniref:HTH tetR-type domain-containing protein n=1 Tax=Aureimonas endophytica TaxID=2027858 RepID=A0A917E1W9_9HYPH|nr:TetR/AcrR family transcriptional regulator [Aureimonas endophytica]GGD94132.1 hypothetical protein GCM10011390_11060 [Aureimonas endophytica]
MSSDRLFPFCPLSRRPGRPPTLSEGERRQRILEAAGEVFVARGYAAARMDDVAKGCGMSKKTVYQAFETKERLFTELVAAALGAMPALDLGEEAGREDGEAFLRKALQDLTEILLHPRQIALARLVIAETQAAPELALGLHEKGMGGAKAILSEAVMILKRRGLLAPQADADLGSFLLGAVIGDAAILSLIGRAPPPTPAAIAERIDRLFAMLRPTLFAPSPDHSA